MNLELEAFEGELTSLRKIKKITQHVLAEKLADVYFICGESGHKDRNGLPDKILVCPAYGADWFQIYVKQDLPRAD